MTYLEKQIIKKLDIHGYELAEDTISSVAEYIDRKNEYEDGIYDVGDWINDTEKNYPEKLIDKDVVLTEVTYFLKKRISACFQETGHYPNLEDYEMYLQEDECPTKLGIGALLKILIESESEDTD